MSSSTSKIMHQLGFDAGEYQRLTSWMPEIACELSPGTKVRRYGNGVRVGRKGSLNVDTEGWYSFEADEGGSDPLSLMLFLRPDAEPVELRRFALEWLRTHPGMGSGGQRTELPDHSTLVRQILNDMVPIAGTLAEHNLKRRGIHTDWPVSLAGFVRDDDHPGEGALVGVIVDAHGIPAGVQLGYLDVAGRKMEVGGTERRQFFLNREALGLRFHVSPLDIDPALPVFITEGLENALSLAMAYPMAEIIGLPGIGRMRRLPPFVDRDVVVFRDGDAPGAPASRSLLTGVDALLIGGAQVKVTNTPPDADANSILQEGGIDAIRAVVDGAVEAALSPKGIVEKLAGLKDLDYELSRKTHARTLGIRPSALDDMVTRARARRRGEAEEPEDDPDIHPESVDDIAAVLEVARAEVGQYIVADPTQLDMAVMWSLHSHFVHHASIDIAISPRLLIGAPAAGCGKTSLLEAVGELTAGGLELSSISPAAFFRLNDAQKPTLLIDEIQSLFGRRGGNPELEGLLNASHRRRSAKAIRIEEQANKKLVATKFDAWCTFAATINGKLSPAMESRCLKVVMRRAFPGEVRKHLTDGTSEVLVDCRRKFARWAQDQIALPNVVLPIELHNRAGDNWKPLLKISQLAGGEWQARIEVAALAAVKAGTTPDDITPLLSDIREVMGERERISTAELITLLRDKPDPAGDWNACYRGGPLNAYALRERLRDVLIPPGSQRWKVGTRTVHGYSAEQFADACRRYLPQRPEASESGPAAENFCAEGGISANPCGPSGTDSDNPRETRNNYRSRMKKRAAGTDWYPAPNDPTPVPDTDAVRDPSKASGTSKKRKQDNENFVPGPDGTDQMRKKTSSRTNSQSPPGPQRQGRITEIW
jgi:hypothetical protein